MFVHLIKIWFHLGKYRENNIIYFLNFTINWVININEVFNTPYFLYIEFIKKNLNRYLSRFLTLFRLNL